MGILTRTLSRYGLWAIPVAGILTVLLLFFALLWGLDPSTDQAGFARLVTGAGYSIIGGTYVIGLFCLLFGVLALYTVLAETPARQWAAVGMILGVIAIVMSVGIWTIIVFADATLGDLYQSGQPGVGEAFKVMSGGHWSGRFIPLFVVAALAILIASVSFAVAIWRSGRLPKWLAVTFGVAFLLSVLSAPVILIIPAWYGGLVGAVLLVVTGFVIARKMGQLAGT